jgi:hypothetical protein
MTTMPVDASSRPQPSRRRRSPVIHETGPAGCPGGVVGSPGGVVRSRDRRQEHGPRRVEGWIQRGANEEIFRRAGLDFEAEKEKAATKEFCPLSGLRPDLVRQQPAPWTRATFSRGGGRRRVSLTSFILPTGPPRQGRASPRQDL